MNDLRTAAQQALETLELEMDTRRCKVAIAALRAALAQREEPDLSRCPQCNGPADNGFDRSFPPSPYLCTKCMAEPVQEPVAGRAFLERILTAMEGVIDVADRKTDEFDALRSCVIDLTLMLHTTPPQRKPLTAQQIDGVIERHVGGSEITDAMYTSMEQFARAVEKASWEKNNGQA